MSEPWMYNHVDLRVRDRAEAIAFYDALLPVLGLRRAYDGEWTSYVRDDGTLQWFAFTEEPTAKPGSGRISFAAASHEQVDAVAEAAQRAGARNYEAPSIAYAQTYAVFFEDPSGNKLEVAHAAFA